VLLVGVVVGAVLLLLLLLLVVAGVVVQLVVSCVRSPRFSGTSVESTETFSGRQGVRLAESLGSSNWALCT